MGEGRGIEDSVSEGKVSGEVISRDCVRVESASDIRRAEFLEEVFLEYVVAKKKSLQQMPAANGKVSSNGPGVFDDFLRSSGLKCSSLAQVYKVIKIMEETRASEEIAVQESILEENADNDELAF